MLNAPYSVASSDEGMLTSKAYDKIHLISFGIRTRITDERNNLDFGRE